MVSVAAGLLVVGCSHWEAPPATEVVAPVAPTPTPVTAPFTAPPSQVVTANESPYRLPSDLGGLAFAEATAPKLPPATALPLAERPLAPPDESASDELPWPAIKPTVRTLPLPPAKPTLPTPPPETLPSDIGAARR